MRKSPAYQNSGWHPRSNLAVARSHPATSVFQNKIYVFGGGGPEFKSLNSVEIYDPRSDQWAKGPEMPSLRSGAVAVTIGDAIYVIGGGFKKPDGKFRFLTTVEIFRPRTGTWESGPDMIMPHDYPAVALLEDYIYIMGGHHPEATSGGPQTDPGFSYCERFLPVSTGWEEIAPLPTARFALSAVVHDGHILTFGGVAFTPRGFNEYDCVEIYDPVLGGWSRSKDLVLPWPAAAHGSCLLGNRLYIFGGFSGEKGIGTQAAVYDYRSKNWSHLPSLPQPRAAMGVVTLDRTIYLIGGWASDRSVMNSVLALPAAAEK